MNAIRVSDAALEWVRQHGGDMTLRAATRHGCCGGSAAVPVAELRRPDAPDAFEQIDMAGIRIHVAYSLRAVPLAVDIDGFGKWQRLIVEGPVQPPT